MRSLLLFGLFIFFLVIIQFAQAQTVDEIIDKYVLARGGKDKLLGVKSIYMEGSSQMMGNKVTISVTKEQGKLSRTEFDAAGTTGYILITDKEAWNYFPMQSKDVLRMPEDAVADLQTELDIAGALVEYSARGCSAELVGKNIAGEHRSYNIKLIFPDGKERHYFIDASSYLLVKSSSVNMFGRRTGDAAAKPAGPVETITIYDDYKPVDGILFPHNIETKNPGVQGSGTGGIVFDKIALNIPVDPKLYNI